MMIHKMTFCIAFSIYCSVSYSQYYDSTYYKYSCDIYNYAKKDTAYWQGGVTSSDLSFIGLYKQALFEYDKPRKDEMPAPISEADSLDFVTHYYLSDAKSFIIEKAKENQVIIFNETHHNPRDRVFITSLLQDLKKVGFIYFAAETFMNDSSFLIDKPPGFSTGYYTMEPQFGNLVREAVKLNYKLYPYESTDTIYTGYARELGQARNIKKLLEQDPKAKIIIYCGYGHILEDDSIPDWGKAMAGRLKEITGINPYTFDQIKLSERYNTALENPYYKLIHANTYSVLLNNKGEPFHNKSVDAMIYMPRSKYLYSRPTWIFENGKYPYILDSIRIIISFPVIIKAYLQTDNVHRSIPIDIIEVQAKQEMSKTAIALFQQGQFTIVISNKNGDRQLINISK